MSYRNFLKQNRMVFPLLVMLFALLCCPLCAAADTYYCLSDRRQEECQNPPPPSCAYQNKINGVHHYVCRVEDGKWLGNSDTDKVIVYLYNSRKPALLDIEGSLSLGNVRFNAWNDGGEAENLTLNIRDNLELTQNVDIAANIQVGGKVEANDSARNILIVGNLEAQSYINFWEYSSGIRIFGDVRSVSNFVKLTGDIAGNVSSGKNHYVNLVQAHVTGNVDSTRADRTNCMDADSKVDGCFTAHAPENIPQSTYICQNTRIGAGPGGGAYNGSVGSIRAPASAVIGGICCLKNGACMSDPSVCLAATDSSGQTGLSGVKACNVNPASISKTVDDANPAPNATVTFTITARPNPADALDNLLVEDILPEGLTLESHWADVGSIDWRASERKLTWHFPKEATQQGTLKLKAKVSCTATNQISNLATLYNYIPASHQRDMLDQSQVFLSVSGPCGELVAPWLPTRVSGQDFELDIQSIVGNGNFALLPVTGKAEVALLPADTSSQANCAALTTVPASALAKTVVDFGKTGEAKAKAAFNVNAAVSAVRVWMRKEDGSQSFCPADTFAIRPATFFLQSPMSNISPDTGEAKAAAGTPFALHAYAFSAKADKQLGAYTLLPKLDTKKIGGTGSRGGGHYTANAPLTGTFSFGQPGMASGVDFRYADVGTLEFSPGAVYDDQFTAADQRLGKCLPNSADNTPDASGRVGCRFANQKTFVFGRWHPAAFAFEGVLSPTCADFVYMGQPFETTLSVRALTTDGQVTPHYGGDLTALGQAHPLGGGNVVAFHAENVGHSLGLAQGQRSPWARRLSALDCQWTAGRCEAQVSATFAKATDPDGPYADFAVMARLADPDPVSFDSADTLASSNRIRLLRGQLWANNAYGPTRQVLPVPFAIRYWAGHDWRHHARDTCTPLALPDVANGGLPSGQVESRWRNAESVPEVKHPENGSARLELSMPQHKAATLHLDLKLKPVRDAALGPGQSQDWLDLARDSVRLCFGRCGPRHAFIWKQERVVR
jgi:uncharacterized repeat protein (TIGR01451 family)